MLNRSGSHPATFKGAMGGEVLVRIPLAAAAARPTRTHRTDKGDNNSIDDAHRLGGKILRCAIRGSGADSERISSVFHNSNRKLMAIRQMRSGRSALARSRRPQRVCRHRVGAAKIRKRRPAASSNLTLNCPWLALTLISRREPVNCTGIVTRTRPPAPIGRDNRSSAKSRDRWHWYNGAQARLDVVVESRSAVSIITH